MPRAKEKSSGGLSIELDDNRKFYTPGSKVSGTVTLSTAQDFAIGSVNIEFYGRVKGKQYVDFVILTRAKSTSVHGIQPRSWRNLLSWSSTSFHTISDAVPRLS